ncbi:DUF4189 domain-containing protein [Nocardia huaxiensis]|uniref:DUF4189 domain-containing protein n=1 Tax=Nocardia huaxiensis TaxID=2755382 RepID=A0A7D6VFN6_9NOCA|nr:DUF4189 domain-containing protein [Nocardia huaxiensis]QLY28510.1 DUF4189 domain-containing protein [Nocardia huaxiensis]UFS98035.1 DUF4189 domain-containing protein [Nocardia huaxiensis]
MSLSRKLAHTLVIPVAGALALVAPGTAHAARDLYGAMAVSYTPGSYAVGIAVDYTTQDEADQAAKDACAGYLGCTVLLQIHNECGAVLERDYRLPWGAIKPTYYMGTGPTAAAAEEDARAHAGPDGDLLAPYMYMVKPLFLLDTACTSNAG